MHRVLAKRRGSMCWTTSLELEAGCGFLTGAVTSISRNGFANTHRTDAPMDHDFDAQRKSTFWAWNDLSNKNDLPESAHLDMQFIPDSETADWAAFEDRLASAGYRTRRYEDGSTLEATIGPITLGPEPIWKHELATTRIALECGFVPDGWGFWSE